MTLATVPRYDGDRLSPRGGHAVVVGGGIAGLLAARVLADGFEGVTLVERDPLPDEPVPRRGVPQSRHIHVMLEAGRATLEDLFRGTGRTCWPPAAWRSTARGTSSSTLRGGSSRRARARCPTTPRRDRCTNS
ncbi:MAG: tryptophan 7-halogenase [Haloferacaceae archaeon]